MLETLNREELMNAAILIPIVAPAVTELVKWLVREIVPDRVIKRVPKTLVPTVSTAIGGLLAFFVPELGVDPTTGALGGAAGTAVHQTLSLSGLSKLILRNKKAHAILVPLLLYGLLAGCSEAVYIQGGEKATATIEASMTGGRINLSGPFVYCKGQRSQPSEAKPLEQCPGLGTLQ